MKLEAIKETLSALRSGNVRIAMESVSRAKQETIKKAIVRAIPAIASADASCLASALKGRTPSEVFALILADYPG